METLQLIFLFLIWLRLSLDSFRDNRWCEDLPGIFTKIRQIKGSLSVMVPHAEDIDMYADQQRTNLESINRNLEEVRRLLDEINDKQSR